MSTVRFSRKDWKPKFGWSRRNDSAFVNFATAVGKRTFGLFGRYFYFNGASLRHTVQTLLSSSSAIAVDASLGSVWRHLTTEDTTIGVPSNLVDGGVYILHLTQEDTTPRTFGFNAVFKLAGGIFTITASTNAVDVLTFVSDGTNLYETARSQADA